MKDSPFLHYLLDKLDVKKKVIQNLVDYHVKKEEYDKCIEPNQRIESINKIIKKYGKR